MNSVPMTQPGLDKVKNELKKLTTIDRPSIIKAIAEAREHGDLGENAEYHAAREQQSLIEGRIKELNYLVNNAEVIDISTLDGPIKFGATVFLRDENSGAENIYQLVSAAEADIQTGRLNINSPLAKALIGYEEGDCVEVQTPSGLKDYTILKVEYVSDG